MVDENDEQPSKAKKAKLDIHRTGAKSNLDPLKDGDNFHKIGEVRTKPGRGDPTQSLSCSDKIAKWCLVGFQGSLLSAFFVEPLIPKAIIIGSQQADEESLARAFFTRFGFTKNVDLWTNCKKTRENKGHGDQDEYKEFSVKGQLACDASIFWNKNQGPNHLLV